MSVLLKMGAAVRTLVVVLACCAVLIGTAIVVLTSRGSRLKHPEPIVLPPDAYTQGETLRLLVFDTDGTISVLAGDDISAMHWSVYGADGRRSELPPSHPPLLDFATAAGSLEAHTLDFGLRGPGIRAFFLDDKSTFPSATQLSDRLCDVEDDDLFNASSSDAQRLADCSLLGIRAIVSRIVYLGDDRIASVDSEFMEGGGMLSGVVFSGSTDDTIVRAEITAAPTISGIVHFVGYTSDTARSPVIWHPAGRDVFVGERRHPLPRSVRGSQSVRYYDDSIFAYDGERTVLTRWDLSNGASTSIELPQLFVGKRRSAVYVTDEWAVVFGSVGATIIPRRAFDHSESVEASIYPNL
ncbi:MAG: hypothetical protein Tsb0013_24730 [Phycisphaerales bacterium]